MPMYEKGDVRIHYEEAGSGFPLLVIPGGGLNSTVAGLAKPPVQPARTSSRTSIALSPRICATPMAASPQARSRSTGRGTPTPTTTRADGPSRHRRVNGAGLLHRRPVYLESAAARAPARRRRVLAQPSGYRPDDARPVLSKQHQGLGAAAVERRTDITMAKVDAFLEKMYRANADFVFTVTRDFVRNCHTPVLILPDDVPAHPYAVAMESALLRPMRRSASIRGRPIRSRSRSRCVTCARS